MLIQSRENGLLSFKCVYSQFVYHAGSSESDSKFDFDSTLLIHVIVYSSFSLDYMLLLVIVPLKSMFSCLFGFDK